jgi:hypothetical protein
MIFFGCNIRGFIIPNKKLNHKKQSKSSSQIHVFKCHKSNIRTSCAVCVLSQHGKPETWYNQSVKLLYIWKVFFLIIPIRGRLGGIEYQYEHREKESSKFS